MTVRGILTRGGEITWGTTWATEGCLVELVKNNGYGERGGEVERGDMPYRVYMRVYGVLYCTYIWVGMPAAAIARYTVLLPYCPASRVHLL